ncbi:MAG: 3-phosphoshikimate 1-carboxyvinyltransferase [Candidatus Gracilibacteria bacterium]
MPVIIKVPGSKSITNRALTLAALSKQTTTIKNAAICDDSHYMAQALNNLGIPTKQKADTITVSGRPFPKQRKTIHLYTENAGTATRFLTALATLTNNKVIIDGNTRMRCRPIQALADALNQLGTKVQTTNGYPPVTVLPSLPKGNSVKIRGDISSQFISAIMMIALPFRGTKIHIEQEIYSKPYIALTKQVIKEFQKHPKTYTVESDASSAAYISAFAAIHPNTEIILENIFPNSKQGDIKFLRYFQKLGLKITTHSKGTLISSPKQLKSLRTVDMNATPDLVMIFAVLAAITKGTTKITNIANLRIKETDRIQALKNELSKLKIKVKTTNSSITIIGNPNLQINKKVLINSYDDHRIAMAFGILQSRFPNLKIKNPNCVSKSYPTFWTDLKTLQNSQKNIVLIGLRGSGKTKLGKLLAKQLNMPFIDTDHEIEKLLKKPLIEIITKKGWEYFRQAETAMIKKVAQSTQTILATGGGAILNPQNAKTLKTNGILIYLHRKPEVCAKILSGSHARPALTKETSLLAEMRKLYKDRHPIYTKHADHTIERSYNLKNDCEKIIEIL